MSFVAGSLVVMSNMSTSHVTHIIVGINKIPTMMTMVLVLVPIGEACRALRRVLSS